MDDVDVVVLGSGAAGLTAALAARDGGASVALLEKADKIGGTSAWSGGMVWIPCNDHMPEIGVEDSEDDAVEYLMSMSHGLMNETLIRTFVQTGPQMVRWLESTTPVAFQPVGHFPDYHPERPGGKPRGGRSLECPLYSFKNLGEWAARVSVGDVYPHTITTMGESPLGQPTPITIADDELERRRINDERGCGQSLVGRLLRACVDSGVDIRTGAQACELLQREGRIDGIVYHDHGTQRVIRTPAVILATGGFEWNDDLVRAFLRGPMTSRVSPQTNTGDGLIMAMKAGASLANMREAWWLPVAEVPRDGAPPLNVLITCERTFPGSIMVNREAKRFTNEAANYNAFGAAFHQMDVARFNYRNLPCWLIFDQAYLDRFGFGQLVPPGGPAPDWVARERTLPALAELLGVSGDSLQRTVDCWNHQVESGRDDDFHRGESANDAWWGDPTCKGRPEATLGKLTLPPPFYAVEIKSGCLGTKGGPRINPDGQVLDHDGAPVTSLYAAGNVMGSPMGMTYGGAGGTIAPGMVFGYRAGQHAATHVHLKA
jgi:3-oxosteroid 1-dehydrogenase